MCIQSLSVIFSPCFLSSSSRITPTQPALAFQPLFNLLGPVGTAHVYVSMRQSTGATYQDHPHKENLALPRSPHSQQLSARAESLPLSYQGLGVVLDS